MIHWLIQSTAAHPDLIRGQAPPALLSAQETDVLNGYTVLKRRQDWLLGRLTTKLLLHEIIRQDSGRTIPLDSISILAGKDGAPRVTFEMPYSDLNSLFSVSISHSQGTSLCAAVARPEYALGADIEHVEPRSENFAADFFTVEELTQIREASPEMRETLVTAVWSAKEAALKAIHEGLRSDTRAVSCHFGGLTEPGIISRQTAAVDSTNMTAAARWQPLRIRWQRDADKERQPPLKGWWMVSGHYVLTLAAEVDQDTSDFDALTHREAYSTDKNDELLAGG